MKNNWSIKTELPISYDIKNSTDIFSIKNKDILSYGNQTEKRRRLIVLDKSFAKYYFDIINEYNVGGLVFGLPLSLNGEENQRTEKVRNFIKELRLESEIIIELYDERFSSDVIFKELRKHSQPSTKIKKKIDQQAAAYILQGFLDNAKNNY